MAANRIKILPREIAEKISAGEVVERPASVVKELVENSVDAGADRITVEIKKGGAELIEAADNGCGISGRDAELCLCRHSTSKLERIEDIGHVSTLGFRGEALPAIASVSGMRIKTRAEDEETGTFIYAEGGRIKRKGKTGAPPGTVISVENLFFNTPARRKFLKSASTELAHINKIITSQALARRDIHFELSHNGKLLLRAPRTDSLADRLVELFGDRITEHLIPVDREEGGAAVSGMLSNPGYSRTQGDHMLFFVNNRAIKSRLLTHAALEAYRPLIPSDRFPFASLFISIAPELVDVNVHPQKTEVKFRDPGKMHDFLKNAVREALNTAGSLPTDPEESRRNNSRAKIFEAVGKYSSAPAGAEPSFDFTPGYKYKNQEGASLPASATTPPVQVHSSYIISEDEKGIIIIDQHAAHEKILYEKLRAQHKKGGILSESLLAPRPVELTPAESAFLEENLALLEAAGFSAEHFGRNTFLLRTVPAELKKAEPEQLFADIVSDLLETGKTAGVEKISDRILSSAACHAAVKAGDKLRPEEMRWIISSLGSLESPYYCPHGRPSMIRMEFSEIAKKFKRSP